MKKLMFYANSFICLALVILVFSESSCAQSSCFLDDVNNGKKQLVDKHLAKGVDPNFKSKAGGTALHIAANNVDLDMIRLLVSNGADIDIRNRLGETPLCAISHYDGKTKAIELLLELGADPNIKSSYGYSPLYWVVRNGEINLIKHMISKRGKIDLFVASGIGDVKLVKQCLDKGADVNAKDGQGYTPLHWAAEGGHASAVAELISRGANVNAVNKTGMTPLHFAAGSFYCRCDRKYRDVSKVKRVAELLITAGADVNAVSEYSKETPLSIAALRNQKELVELLKKHGAHQ